MKEIQILTDMPVIFSKDREYDWKNLKVEAGSIVLLPDDAVLLVAPPNTNQNK